MKKVGVFVAALTLLVCSWASAGGGKGNGGGSGTVSPWSEYGSNAQNTGQSGFVGPSNANSSWSFPLDYNNRDSFSSPVVDSLGTVYLVDSGQINYVYGASLKAIDKNGMLQWERDMSDTCYEDSYGTTAIALGKDNGRLYFSCLTGSWSDSAVTLYAFDAIAGTLIWEKNYAGHHAEAAGNLMVDSMNNLYFVSGYNSEQVINAVSGDGVSLWSTSLGRGSYYDYTGPTLSLNGNTVYIYRSGYATGGGTSYRAGFLDAVRSSNGQLEWELELYDATGWQTATSFAVDGQGTMWFATYDKYSTDSCYGTGEYLFGVSSTGKIKTKWPLTGDLNCGSHLAIGPSGTIYVTYDDPRQYWDGTQWLSWVYGYDAQTGAYQYGWGYRDSTTGQYVIVDTTEIKGGIAAYDPNSGFKWRFNLPDSYEANATPAIDASENIYFAASFGERLYSINKDGQTNWVFDIAPEVLPTNGYNHNSGQDQFIYGVAPIIGLDGSIHVMGVGNLYTISK